MKKNKIIENIKTFIKENYKQLIVLILLIVAVSIELPYYIEAPGGTINITKRIDEDYNKKNGSLNMLYVTQYRGNIVTVLLGKIFNNWDINKISKQQISNETARDIHIRNKIMLENSVQNATFVAYENANIKIDVKKIKNIVYATTKDNGIKIGDLILAVDNTKINNIEPNLIRINTLNPKGDYNEKICCSFAFFAYGVFCCFSSRH